MIVCMNREKKSPNILFRSPSAPASCRAVALLVALLPLTGCIVVGGYTSGGGWFLWPGSFGFLFVVLILFLLLRRRR